MGVVGENIIGKTFGLLTVVEDLGVYKKEGNKKKDHYYSTICECGNKKIISKSNLTKKGKRSCGCLINSDKIKDIAGERFGKLVAVKSKKNKHGRFSWFCVCDCGNEVLVDISNLTAGSVKSCGCLRKESEQAKEQSKKLAKIGQGVLKDKVLKEGTRIDILHKKNPQKNNKTSSRRGVCFSKRTGKWIAYLNFKGKRKNLGSYNTEDEAIQAREIAEETYFKPTLERYKTEVEYE